MMSETFHSINKWQRDTFPNATATGILIRIEEEWQELQNAETTEDRIEEAVDLIIVLAAYIAKLGLEAQYHIDQKMRINRQRQWNIQPDGTGRHK
jgi:NTP pyrophosphatase (non-canonical NTP hydrolase)